MRKRAIYLTLLTLPLILSGCNNTSSSIYSNSDDTLTVSISDSNAYSVTSQNPLQVQRGENASFDITFSKGYDFESSSAGTYSDGRITLENVQYSQTIDIFTIGVYEVYVEVPSDAHFRITSDNPAKVREGQDATFTVDFDKQYAFVSTSVGTFKDNTLTISNVTSNLNVTLTERFKGDIHFVVENDSLKGEIVTGGDYDIDDYGNPGETFSFTAVPKDGYRFVCWSLNEPISSVMPYSFERTLEFTIEEDITLVANYWSNEADTIIYDANGGSTESGDTIIYYPHTKANRVRVNTVQGSKCFSRDGYLLDSWNTKQDGTGERIGLGSRMKTSSTGEYPTLYAQWVKETPTSSFTFELNEAGDAYSITGCTSTDAKIVLPNYYEGLPITKLSTGALNSLPFEKLWLNENMLEVESGAISDCASFNEIHFFDSLNIIPDDFSSTMPSWLYINANTDPCFTSTFQSLLAKKVDLLTECGSEKIIIIGNTNALYSVDGATLASAFNTDVLCMGVQTAVGIAWELAIIKKYCQDDNNTIVFCPEFGADSIGSFNEVKYRSAECNYDVLSCIDFNVLAFPLVYSSFTTFKSIKNETAPSSYSKDEYHCDEYGYRKVDTEPLHSDDWTAGVIRINQNFYANGGFKWIEDYLSSLTNSTIYYSSCSFNRNCIAEDYRETFYSTYQQSIIDNVSYKVISKLEDYAFPGSAINSGNYQLIYSYAIERANRLVADIQAA